jgi:hypothetical protein
MLGAASTHPAVRELMQAAARARRPMCAPATTLRMPPGAQALVRARSKLLPPRRLVLVAYVLPLR